MSSWSTLNRVSSNCCGEYIAIPLQRSRSRKYLAQEDE
jgi:hypothetical protein